MKFKIFIASFFLSLNIFSQTDFTKATFKGKNITNEIADKMISLYGKRSPTDDVVILQLTVLPDGKIDEVSPVFYRKKENALFAIVALQETSGKWSPTLVDGKPVKQLYKAIINVGVASIEKNVDALKDAEKLVKRKKYKKAIKIYDKAIKSFSFDYRFYAERSLAKKQLNDVEGARLDSLEANKLKKEYLFNIYFGIYSIQRKEVLRTPIGRGGRGRRN